MSLTRKDVRNILENSDMSTEEKVARIIGGHIESLDGLNDKIATLESANKRLEDAEKELSTLKDENWKKKYEEEHSDFESYKKEQEAAASKAKQDEAFSEFVKNLKLTEDGKKKVEAYNRDKVEFAEDGSIKNPEEIAKQLEEEWSAYKDETVIEGADVSNPPANNLGGNKKFDDMSLSEKMFYANEHPTDPAVLNFLK